MSMQPVRYFNRYTGQIETEEIYGEKFLRWAYGNPLGRLCLHAVVKHALFSRWYGWRMNRPASRRKIAPFIARYRVRTDEFDQPPESFRSFNEFFCRHLKPSARPIAPGEGTAVFPADGRHLGFGTVSEMEGVFVKGQVFELGQLLQDPALASRYRDGTMVVSRLCPTDYHRFHFPAAGVPDQPRILPGPLCSVNPVALRRNIRILATNKRALSRLVSDRFGQVLMLEIGATNVGSLRYTYTPGRSVPKGAEKGCFEFGGSSIILLFEKGRLRLADDLLRQSAQGLELFAQVGDRMGQATDSDYPPERASA